MPLSIEPDQHSTTYYMPQHMHVPTHTCSYMHTNTYTKAQTNIDFIILISKWIIRIFFKHQKYLNSVKVTGYRK